MNLLPFFALAVFAGSPVLAEETRQLDAHEHGVGQLDIAFDGQQIAMELHAPGADIVGFEYAAESAEDRAAVDAAVGTLARPLDLFKVPASAECTVVQASAELEGEEAHDDHGEDHAEGEGHAEGEEHADGEDHAEGEEHAEGEGHGEHDHEGEHDEHADETSHTEFHAEYLLTCAHSEAVSEITFAYFEAFPNALEVEVQVVSDAGATAFEVERDAPTLDLRGAF